MRILVTGEWRMVGFVVRHLAAAGHEVAALVADASSGQRLSEGEAELVVVGEASDPTALEAAGARRCDAVLALGDRDEQNVVCCQIARRLFGVPRTVALANDPDNEEVYRRLGIDVGFSAVPLVATLIEQRAELDDIRQLLPVAEGKVAVIEVSLRREAPAVGHPLRELGLSPGSLIACVLRDGSAIVPRGDTVLASDDRLIVVSASEHVAEVVRELTGAVRR